MDGGFAGVKIPAVASKTKIRALVDSQLVIFDNHSYVAAVTQHLGEPHTKIEFSYRIPLLYHPNNGITIQVIIKDLMQVIIGPYQYQKIECREFDLDTPILDMDFQTCLPCS